MLNEKVRAYGDYDSDFVSQDTGLYCKDPSLAIQSQKDEADINTIVRNFGITGKLPDVIYMPEYGDFTEVGDYRSAIDTVRLAEESFMTLPADIRSKFENNPQEFMAFVHNPSNAQAMLDMGLRVKPISEAPPAIPKDVSVNPTPGA